jgi:hypothetical protein
MAQSSTQRLLFACGSSMFPAAFHLMERMGYRGKARAARSGVAQWKTERWVTPVQVEAAPEWVERSSIRES